MRIIREAHSVSIDGVLTPVPITAAAFDPTNQLLITGASDGSLKVTPLWTKFDSNSKSLILLFYRDWPIFSTRYGTSTPALA